eukprot:CAMPEP_0202006498 /NCGR_PEP_ID=MMETSP0905-20130828/11233_1 /ASSEMBLY_ACC=CAM_ASM_000554 /TAXON_ID=420261 /ORGANISM="Thalassiosira antarctica, Strain CCMP982" /LENGTH=32 /DNA_ID= /DNA_START= /DNA_END= /DNA_ORIENTATION=
MAEESLAIMDGHSDRGGSAPRTTDPSESCSNV